MCEAFDEGAIKIEKAYCPSYFCDVFGCWPHVYSHNFYRVHACHPLFKDYPQVIHGRCMEEAFFGFEIEVMHEGDLKDVSDCCNMVCHVGTCSNTDIVHIYANCGAV